MPSFAIIEKFRAMKKFVIILIIFSFLGFQINGCAFFSQTENREAVGAASGGILGFAIGGNALGVIIGALSGTLVAPAIGYFYDKKIAPRKKAAEKYKLRDGEEKLVIEKSSIVPQNVASGSAVETSIQYTVLAPIDVQQIRITETKMLTNHNEGVIEITKREVLKTQGTHISKFKFTVPKKLSKGDYTLITIISNGKQTRSAMSPIRISGGVDGT